MLKSKLIAISYILIFFTANNSCIHATFDEIVGGKGAELCLEKKMKVYNHPNPYNYPNPNTRAIARAICRADVTELEKLLKPIENPNDRALLVPGYRQIYNLVNLAVDPDPTYLTDDNLKNRLKIIDLLGSIKFNFNFIPSEEENYGYVYYNPPLISATGLDGRHVSPDYKSALQARLMLYGADPKIGGSTRLCLSKKETRELAKIAVDMVIEENLKNISPMEDVKTLLRELMEEKKKEEKRKYEESISRLNSFNF